MSDCGVNGNELVAGLDSHQNQMRYRIILSIPGFAVKRNGEQVCVRLGVYHRLLAAGLVRDVKLEGFGAKCQPVGEMAGGNPSYDRKGFGFHHGNLVILGDRAVNPLQRLNGQNPGHDRKTGEMGQELFVARVEHHQLAVTHV